MAKDIYISKELVLNDEISELDLILKDDFKFNYDGNGNFIEFDVIKDKKLRQCNYVDTNPLKVSDLEKMIVKLKKKGATHVQIDHHGDHHGYDYSGFKIELADDSLVKKYKDEEQKKKVLYKEYNKLQLRMNEIHVEVNKLKR